MSFQTVLFPTDFHCIFWLYNGSQWEPKVFPTFFKTSFVFNRRNSYMFGTTWGWGTDDKIYNFGWSVSFRAIQKLENILYNIMKYVQFTCKYLSIQRVDRTWIWKWTTSGHLVAVILCKCELSFRRYRGEKRHTLDMEYLSFFLILFLRADSLCLPATEWDRWRGKCRSLCMPSVTVPVSTHIHACVSALLHSYCE